MFELEPTTGSANETLITSQFAFTSRRRIATGVPQLCQ